MHVFENMGSTSRVRFWSKTRNNAHLERSTLWIMVIVFFLGLVIPEGSQVLSSHPSIHYLELIQFWVPHLATSFTLFWGVLKDIIFPASPGSNLGPPPDRSWPKHLGTSVSRRHPKQMPKPQLATIDVVEQWLCSESSWMSKLHISLKESPATLRRKIISTRCIRNLILLTVHELKPYCGGGVCAFQWYEDHW